MEQAILRALAKKPAERFASARDMVAALEHKGTVNQYDTFTLSRENLKEFHKRAQDAQNQERHGEAAQAEGLPRKLIIGAIVLAVIIVVVLVLILAGQGAAV